MLIRSDFLLILYLEAPLGDISDSDAEFIVDTVPDTQQFLPSKICGCAMLGWLWIADSDHRGSIAHRVI